ncbi:ABC transporter permease [Streptomyces varsoviensis]|uniref:ABC transporter permease n=1 Tax=Streptomyces varsoviensis TaxID=67373 RepID=UPI0004C5F91F|nr:ABC transporter permease [Streptomyces varsoviensis]
MLRTALRNVFAHKARLVMTALAIILGTAFVSGTLIFGDTAGNAYRNVSAKNYRGVAVLVTANEGIRAPGDQHRTALDERLADKIRALPGVASVRPSATGYATIADKKQRPMGEEWQSLGADFTPGKDGKDSRYPLTSGRGPAAADEIALSTKAAADGGYRLGDRVRFAIDGPVLTKKLVGTVDTTDPRVTSGGTLALFDTATAQRLYSGAGSFSEFSVGARPGVDDVELTERIQRMLPEEKASAQSGSELARIQADEITMSTRSLTKSLMVFAGIALFVGAFIVANTFTMLISQRRREIALLRAVGASRRQVVRSTLVEAAVLGLLASVAGFVLGLGVALGLRPLLNSTGAHLPDGPLIVEPASFGYALVIGVVVTVLSAWLPARRAARVAPVEALSEIDQAPAQRSLVVRGVIGAVLGGAGVATMFYVATKTSSEGINAGMAGSALVLAGAAVLAPLLSRPLVTFAGKGLARMFPASGRLATRNALRNPRRTAATASALMIGLTLITGLTVLGHSATLGVDKMMERQGLTADYQVSSEGGWGLGKDAAGRLSAVPGVAAAVPLRTVGVDLGSDAGGLTGTDVSNLGKVAGLRFTSGSAEAVRAKNTIAVSEKTAGERGLRTGQRLKVTYNGDESGAEDEKPGRAKGPKTATYTIGGIYTDNEVVPKAFVSLATIASHVNQPSLANERILVKAEPGKASGLADKLRSALGSNPLVKVKDQSVLRAERSGSIGDILNMTYGLLGMALVIAVVGVVNTLAMSVFERTREIGMLRAIGLARRDVKRMVRLESVMICVFGAVLGIVVGGFLAWSGGHLVKSSFPAYEFGLPWPRIGLFLLIALVVGVLAAVWPARRAGRLSPLESMGVQ